MSAFIVSDETMHRVVRALDIYGPSPDRVTRSDGVNTSVGRGLFAMNNLALRERYGDRYPEDFTDPAHYAYEHREATPAALYRAVACFLYQCAEGNVPDSDLYKLVERVMHHLEETVTGDHDAHSLTRSECAMKLTDDQPWDF